MADMRYHDPFCLEVLDIGRCWSGHCECSGALFARFLQCYVFEGFMR